MKRLLNDVSRCHGVGCNEKESCLRYTQHNDIGENVPRAATMFPYDDEEGPCMYKIEVYE